MVRIVIDDFKHNAGANCQLSSLRKVLAYYNIEISEPMILGLCSGLGFFYFYMKRMPFPMVLGLAVKKTEVFERILNRLGGSVKITETASENAANNNLIALLEKGQPAPTLSGGEAQRVKLAKELGKARKGNSLYILDEPTVGLSFYDAVKLIQLLDQLVQEGNSVLIIEHDLDILAYTD